MGRRGVAHCHASFDPFPSKAAQGEASRSRVFQSSLARVRTSAGAALAVAAAFLALVYTNRKWRVLAWLPTAFYALLSLGLGAASLCRPPEPATGGGRAPSARHPVDRKALPAVAVLVACRNEESHVEGLVSTAMSQVYDAELVLFVANDASTDGTLPALLRCRARYGDRVRVVDLPPRVGGTIPRAMSALVQHVPPRFTVLVELDADSQLASPRLVQEGAEALLGAGPEVGALQTALALQGDSSWLARGQRLERFADDAIARARAAAYGSADLHGSGVLYRRIAVTAAGGWNRDVVNEDLDMTMRLMLAGYRVRHAPWLLVKDAAAPTLPALLAQRSKWLAHSLGRHLVYSPRVARVLGARRGAALLAIAAGEVVATLLWLHALAGACAEGCLPAPVLASVVITVAANAAFVASRTTAAPAVLLDSTLMPLVWLAAAPWAWGRLLAQRLTHVSVTPK